MARKGKNRRKNKRNKAKNNAQKAEPVLQEAENSHTDLADEQAKPEVKIEDKEPEQSANSDGGGAARGLGETKEEEIEKLQELAKVKQFFERRHSQTQVPLAAVKQNPKAQNPDDDEEIQDAFRMIEHQKSITREMLTRVEEYEGPEVVEVEAVSGETSMDDIFVAPEINKQVSDFQNIDLDNADDFLNAEEEVEAKEKETETPIQTAETPVPSPPIEAPPEPVQREDAFVPITIDKVDVVETSPTIPQEAYEFIQPDPSPSVSEFDEPDAEEEELVDVEREKAVEVEAEAVSIETKEVEEEIVVVEQKDQDVVEPIVADNILNQIEQIEEPVIPALKEVEQLPPARRISMTPLPEKIQTTPNDSVEEIPIRAVSPVLSSETSLDFPEEKMDEILPKKERRVSFKQSNKGTIVPEVVRSTSFGGEAFRSTSEIWSERDESIERHRVCTQVIRNMFKNGDYFV